MQFLEGKKTYLIALIAGGLAVAQALGYVIPEYVWGILGALGLGSLRAGVAKMAKI